MKTTPRGPVLFLIMVLALAVPLAAAAAEPVPPPGPEAQCPVCGMYPAEHPRWVAAVRFDDGAIFYFDGPRDLFKYLNRPSEYGAGQPPGAITAALVTDHPSTRLVDAREAYFVVGSDLMGPMGHDAVPFGSEAAARGFMAAHGGVAVLRLEDFSPAVVAHLQAGAFDRLLGAVAAEKARRSATGRPMRQAAPPTGEGPAPRAGAGGQGATAPAATPARDGGARPVLVSLTSADPWRAGTALHWTLEAMARGHPATVWLNVDAVRLAVTDRSVSGPAGGFHAREALREVIRRGGTVLVCPRCLAWAGLEDARLLEGARMGYPDVVMPRLLDSRTRVLTW